VLSVGSYHNWRVIDVSETHCTVLQFIAQVMQQEMPSNLVSLIVTWLAEPEVKDNVALSGARRLQKLQEEFDRRLEKQESEEDSELEEEQKQEEEQGHQEQRPPPKIKKK